MKTGLIVFDYEPHNFHEIVDLLQGMFRTHDLPAVIIDLQEGTRSLREFLR